MHVVLVDDDDLVRACLQDILDEAGFLVWSAANPDDALTLMSEVASPAALVCDVGFGTDRNGLWLAKSVRQRRPDIQIILMSGDIEFEKMLPSDCRFLRKPFCSEELVAAILGTR